MKKLAVVDTNVAVAANDRSPQAALKCVLACVEALDRIQRSQRLAFDDGYRIIDEYRQHLSPSGQPGVGDAFFKWVWQNQANPECCEVVKIHLRPGSKVDFEEFPNDPALVSFDKSDRKFVAVARASPSNPPILNAVDSDWWNFRDALESHGVTIEFLCPERFVPKKRR